MLEQKPKVTHPSWTSWGLVELCAFSLAKLRVKLGIAAGSQSVSTIRPRTSSVHLYTRLRVYFWYLTVWLQFLLHWLRDLRYLGPLILKIIAQSSSKIAKEAQSRKSLNLRTSTLNPGPSAGLLLLTPHLGPGRLQGCLSLSLRLCPGPFWGEAGTDIHPPRHDEAELKEATW